MFTWCAGKTNKAYMNGYCDTWKIYLDSIGILSTGNLYPHYCFLPTCPARQYYCKNALDMIHRVTSRLWSRPVQTCYWILWHGPCWHLAWTEESNMIVAFPVFVKDHAQVSPKTTVWNQKLVKVPIPDKNDQKLMVTQKLTYSKPYMAINKDYYIQLHIQELCMCKHDKTYLLLWGIIPHVKHKSKAQLCKSAIFYNLTAQT